MDTRRMGRVNRIKAWARGLSEGQLRELLAELVDNGITGDTFSFYESNLAPYWKVDGEPLIKGQQTHKVNVCVNYLCNGIDSPENATLARIDSIGNATNVKEEEEVKGKGEEEEEKPPFVLPDWIDQNLWKEFLKVQKKKKTDFAKTLAVGTLEKFRNAGHDIDAIMKHSIEGGWSRFFEPNNKPAVSQKQKLYQESVDREIQIGKEKARIEQETNADLKKRASSPETVKRILSEYKNKRKG